MNRKLFGLLNETDNIVGKSTKAVCGIMERQIVVKSSEVNKVKSKLRSAGYIIIGTGDAGFNRKKIWFNPAGMVL